VQQIPAEGEKLAYGEIIQVTISGSVSVPSFTGLTRSQALVLASQAGLSGCQFVEYPTTDESQYERIADQQPKTSERIMYNEPITLLIYVPQATEAPVQPTETPMAQDGQGT